MKQKARGLPLYIDIILLLVFTLSCGMLVRYLNTYIIPKNNKRMQIELNSTLQAYGINVPNPVFYKELDTETGNIYHLKNSTIRLATYDNDSTVKLYNDSALLYNTDVLDKQCLDKLVDYVRNNDMYYKFLLVTDYNDNIVTLRDSSGNDIKCEL